MKKIGDRVYIYVDGERVSGTLKEIDDDKYVVLLLDGSQIITEEVE